MRLRGVFVCQLAAIQDSIDVMNECSSVVVLTPLQLYNFYTPRLSAMRRLITQWPPFFRCVNEHFSTFSRFLKALNLLLFHFEQRQWYLLRFWTGDI